MAFTMSYGTSLPPAKPAPASPAQKPRSARARKGSSAQAQAEALFDPALSGKSAHEGEIPQE